MSNTDSSTHGKKPALPFEVQTMAKETIDAVFKKVMRRHIDNKDDKQKVKDNTPILQEMERYGLANVSGMDDANKKAWEVLNIDGAEAAVQFMFKHPTEKNPVTGEVRTMSYAEMRTYYG